MTYLSRYKGEKIEVELSSKKQLTGILIEYGSDIAVIHDGKQYFYIPLLHVQYLKLSQSTEQLIQATEPPIENEDQKLTFRKVLNNAKGLFVEIFVNGNQSIHGYITSVMNNYFIFYSPVYKTMYIPINHLKWLIPFHLNEKPYSLSKQHFPVNPSTMTLARTFEEQLKKLEGKIVVFDLGASPNKIGLLKKMDNNIVELVNGREEIIHWNLNHLKTLHTVDN